MTVDRDTLVAYALGSLTEKEERTVASYLRSSPNDAAFVRDLFESLAEVALSQAPAEVPENSAARLLSRVRDLEAEDAQASLPGPPAAVPDSELNPVRGRVPPAAWWGGIAAVLALLVVFTVLWPFGAPDTIDARLSRACAEAGTVCEALLGPDEEALGTLALRVDGRGLVVLDREPPPGSVYQAWAIVGGEPNSLGVFEGVALEFDTPISPGAAFAVTVEPPGGSPLPTSEPILIKQT